MKKIILLMVLIGLPISLVAQEVPDPLTAGYSQCKFLPGKGMESLEEYIELFNEELDNCLLYTSPSPRDKRQSRMPSSA